MIFLILLALALPWLVSCSDDGPTGAPCPIGGAPGPALSPGGEYLLVAHSLGETWEAMDLLADTLETLPGTGFTGQAPNDIEVAGNRMYSVNSLDNSVSVVDLATGRTLGCIAIGASTNPYELEIDPADPARGWLTTFLSGELVELDLARLRVLRRIQVGPALQGLWVGNDVVAVTLTGYDAVTYGYGPGYALAYAKSNLAEIARLPVSTNPTFLFEGADGRVHVVCTGDYGATSTGRVARIEADFSAVRDTLDLGGAPGRAVLAGNGIAYLTAFCDGVLAYDTNAFTVVRNAANAWLAGVCAGDAALYGDRLFVAEFDRDAVAVLDRATGAVLQEIPVGDGPIALVVATP